MSNKTRGPCAQRRNGPWQADGAAAEGGGRGQVGEETREMLFEGRFIPAKEFAFSKERS